jgi:hypothetical protein
VVGAIRDCSHLQELKSTETCRSCGPRTFPSDAESPGGIPEFESSRWIDDVLIAARNSTEQHSEFRAELAGRKPELAQDLRIRLMAREGPLYEPKLVVVLDRRRADNDVAER